LEVFSPEQRGIVAKKVSWLEKVAWKSNITSFFHGHAGLGVWVGFMSEGTHEKLTKASTDAALRPYLASACAAQFRELSDYEARRAALIAKKGDSYGMRQAIPEQLVSLPGQRWADDKLVAGCAELILNPPQGKKTAELRTN
jgi:hypothetical protein